MTPHSALPFFPGIDIEEYPTEFRFYDGADLVGTVKRGRFRLLTSVQVKRTRRRLLSQRYPNGTPKDWTEVGNTSDWLARWNQALAKGCRVQSADTEGDSEERCTVHNRPFRTCAERTRLIPGGTE